jgi:hypothetical protein
MKYILLPLLAAASAAFAVPTLDGGAGPENTYLPRVLEPAELTRDLKILRFALEQVHPGATRYTPKATLDAALAGLEARAKRPMTDLELYGSVSKVLALVKCNHTKAEYPRALEAFRTSHPTHLPFRFQLLGGRMFITASDPAQPPLPLGTEHQ